MMQIRAQNNKSEPYRDIWSICGNNKLELVPLETGVASTGGLQQVWILKMYPFLNANNAQQILFLIVFRDFHNFCIMRMTSDDFFESIINSN